MNEVPNRQKGKIMERNYEEIFQKVLDYEQALHEKNRKRIKIGLKCIWIVPLFFLALLFPDWQQQGHLPDPVDRVAVCPVNLSDRCGIYGL